MSIRLLQAIARPTATTLREAQREAQRAIRLRQIVQQRCVELTARVEELRGDRGEALRDARRWEAKCGELTAQAATLAAENTRLRADLEQAHAAAAGRDRGREDADADRDQLRVALRQVLATFIYPTHPGRRCLQSWHVEEERVEEWRAALDRVVTEMPTQDTELTREGL